MPNGSTPAGAESGGRRVCCQKMSSSGGSGGGRMRTEFERARERLVEQLGTERKRLDAVLDQRPTAVILTGARGHVVLQNQAALEVGATKASNGDEVIALDVRLPSGEPPSPDEMK